MEVALCLQFVAVATFIDTSTKIHRVCSFSLHHTLLHDVGPADESSHPKQKLTVSYSELTG